MKNMEKILLLLLFANSLFSADLIPMKELTNPFYITADKDQIYIVEEAAVFIYSRQDFRFKKKFGGNGEGPGEFKIRDDRPINLCVRDNDLVVSSFGRFSYFSKEGAYKTETKTKPVFTLAVNHFGEKFVGIKFLNEMKVTLNIYDEELNLEKELIRVDEELQRSGDKFIFYYLQFPVAYATSFIPYEDKVYVTWGKDEKINVFDKTGKRVAEIPVKVEKQKLTEDYKDKVVNYFKNDKSLPPRIYERYYKNIVFPEFFPAIRDLRISDGKIYVVTYQTDKGTGKPLTRTVILDLKGKPLKTGSLPLQDMDVKSLYPFTIKKGTLYQLVEDFASDNWNLQVTTLENGTPRLMPPALSTSRF
jgi:hypothetical protein